MIRAIAPHTAGSLGILPLAVPIAIGAGALIAGAVGLWKTGEVLVAGSGPAPPNLPPPAPAAPQTRQELETWTPADLWAAQRAAWSRWTTIAVPALTGEKPKATSAWLIGALVIGGISLVLVMR